MNNKIIQSQKRGYLIFYFIFGFISLVLMTYYLSNTLVHFTTARQFSINSFFRHPLTFIIFPAEIFSFAYSVYFVYVLISDKYRLDNPKTLKNKGKTEIAVLLPVYNEPPEILRRTISACKNIIWPGKINIYILDDSNELSYKKSVDSLAREYGGKVIRRKNNIGYKAGNINNALKIIHEEFFLILDSDQAPDPNFFTETMDYFSDEKVAFVQTPQHFVNDNSILRRAVTLGSNIFYRTQSVAKANDGAMPFCGTNVVVRSDAFKQIKGFSYYTSTEDIDLGIRFNENGYIGRYVPEILVNGFAPPDYKAYNSQQYRWANGNLAILREKWHRFLFSDFSAKFQIHMFFTLGWWMVGIITLIYVLVPILSIILNVGTHHAWLPGSVLAFLYIYVILGLTLIFFALKDRVEGEKTSFSDALIQYSLIVNSSFLYAKAAINSLLFKRYIGFVRTNKKRSKLGYDEIKLNLAVASICFIFALYGLYFSILSVNLEQFRTYFPISLWLLFYSLIFFSSILFVDNGGKDE